MKITRERWAEAQKAERECHDNFLRKQSVDYIREHYREVYMRYFDYLDISLDQSGKAICEIGCADFPALEHCSNYSAALLVEPMPSDILLDTVKGMGDYARVYTTPVEEMQLIQSDEIWLLNVMQHVIDPDLFIEKCKASTKVIRFFEPIDWPIEVYHPHTFTFEWYQKHFPEAERYYGTEQNFHTANCAYGVWINDNL